MFGFFLISYFIYIAIKSKVALQMLQQNFYNESNRYLKWSIKNKCKSYITIDLLGFFVVLIIYFLEKPIFSYLLFFIFYASISYITIKKNKQEQVKKPLKITFRIKRLIFTESLLFVILLIFIWQNFNSYYLWFYYLILISLASLIYVVVYLAYVINLPIEKLTYLKYKRRAKRKLEIMKIPTVGITGSYGKTSSKNILADILSVKYRAFPSPTNLNTPLGLMLTVNNYLDKFEQIFIPEMAACITGEIKRICDFIKPTYGIITNIGLAHLETFKTEENIQKTKFELIEALPNNGIGILNKDDPKQVAYKIKNDCQIKWIGIENKDVDLYAQNIDYNSKGMTFDAVFTKDNKTVSFETKLLGIPNVYNILAALLVSQSFNLTYEEMQRGVKNIKPITHRLELKRVGDLNIIDDAYNSNPVGSKMALEVLKIMPGKKIVVTPGMIELKDKQYELNKLFGEYIADVADYVILVGEKQTKPIYDGLMAKDYHKKQISIINDVKLAFPIINKIKDKETFVLLENDLPDLFNE